MGDDEENPYDVLGLQESATPAQIKQAYRKLALKHHPDKQTTEEAKQEAHVKFSKISHAYEILGDETRRREFDLSQQQQQYQGHHQDYYGAGPGYQDNFHFHDPFAVFEQVFAQEFGNHGRANGGSHRQQQQQPMMDPFAGVGMGFGNVFGRDPFAGSGFGGGGGMFDNDPFFGGGGGHQGNAMDPFTQMRQQMHMMRQSQMDMMRQASQQQGGFNDGGGVGGSASSYSYSSSSSTSFGGGGRGGQRESVSTSTRIVNGKRQTVTERVITKPDGSVERHVETGGDDDFPNQYAIGQDSQQQQQQQRPQLENTSNSRRNSRRRWF